MSKFCANCGSQQPDEANICGNCGNAFAPENVVPLMQPKAKSKTPIIIAVAAAALAVILILIFTLGGGGFESAIENRIDFLSGDVSKFEDLAPQAYWEWREEKYEDFDLEEHIEQLEKNREKAEEKGLIKEVNYDYEVTKEVELTEKELKKIQNGLKNRYDIPKDSVTDGVKVDIKLITEYDGEEIEDEEEDIYIVEIDGDWYIVDDDGDFDF